MPPPQAPSPMGLPPSQSPAPPSPASAQGSYSQGGPPQQGPPPNPGKLLIEYPVKVVLLVLFIDTCLARNFGNK